MAKCKYYRLKKQVSYDNGLNWQDVIPYEYIQGPEFEYLSTDCGYVGNLERWINSGTTCEGYDKYNLQVKQISTDGINWATTDETQLGSLIELNSEDCGYVASKKLQLTYSDSTEYDINCNDSTELTQSEVSGGTKPISAITSAEIGDCVTSISRAFSGCTNMTVCNIPNSVTSISQFAFANCRSLTSIDIPNSVTSIGYQAFTNCSSLTSCTIGSGVTSIGDSSFYGCSGLTSITIPSGVTNIGIYAFQNCSGLTAITIEATTPPTLGANAFNNTSCPIYVPCESVNTYKNATNWSDYASRIEAIPNSCHSVKFKAWYSDNTTYSAECDASSALTTADTRAHTTAYSAMTSAVIGSCVTSIGDSAFSGCSSLTSIDIPNSLTSIGDYAFNGCSSLSSITIPNGVTSIGSSTFQLCASLTSITIPSGVTTIGDSAFRNCYGLASIDIPSGVTSIGDRSFLYCSGLTSVNIPNSVTSINEFAFSGCRSLTSITIPNSVTTIGGNAFYSCRSLTSVTVNATEPPTLGLIAFTNTNDCPIYVPAASVNAYKHAINWSDYARRIQAIP